jgi:hypothetical protein
MQEQESEVHRHQSFWRLCRADFGDDGGCLGDPGLGLRRIAAPFGLLRHVWHPALFVFMIYVIVLSCIVLAIAY